jgi:hypothetical protein
MSHPNGVPPGSPGESDDFTEAVLITFNPLAPAALQRQAAEYCDRISQSPDGWRLCLQKLHAPSPSEVKFWCLKLIERVVEHRYAGMQLEEKNLIRRTLMLYVRDVVPKVPQERYIKTKLCTIMVQIVKHDYPRDWPSFFTSVLRHTACDSEGVKGG